ncbi:HRDC domain-containing protein [Corynebacterium sp. A21]|uniref:HRDC domain-containing protein n=1 Tax=Corynebacterium sp. A21 TaxID=3457318 RepID=UPI003FD0EECD
MSTPLITPREGIPPLLATPEEISAAAEQLAAGRGPIAIDTERASGFRYDDRAFLIQLRRLGCGTVLIDPEPYREQIGALLAPVLNGQDWIVHAAPSDLPCLAWLGLYPGRLFDTELAGRLAGLEHVNLAAMIEELLDRSLFKGHGAEDWSQRPLPENWLNYAALDVELLPELAEAMVELLDSQGKLEWAEEEFEYIRATHAGIESPPEPQWRGTKGVGTLNTPEQLLLAREMWLERDSIAYNEDRAVGRILPNRVLIEIARLAPKNERELRNVKGFPFRQAGASRWWFDILRQARTTPRQSWPARIRPPRGLPSKRTWQTEFPESWERLTQIREIVEALGLELQIPTENLIRPAVLRTVVWAGTEGKQLHSPADLVAMLRDEEVRPWQIQLVTPLLSEALFHRN